MAVVSGSGATLADRAAHTSRRVLDFSERNAGTLLAVLVVVGAVVRLIYFGRHWINSDEGIFWQVATGTAEEAARLIQGNAHPPLFYWMLGAVHAAGGGIDPMRSLSLVAGIALPAVVFLVARRWAGSAAGIFAALMIVNAPGVRLLSQVMRPYAMQSVALGLGTLCLFRFLDDGRRRDLVAGGLCWTVALYLHYSTFLVLAGAVAYGGWLVATARVERKRAFELAGVFLLLSLVAGWLYLSHVHPALQGSSTQQVAQEGWLRSGFAQNPVDLLLNGYRAVGYLFGDSFAWLAVLLVPAAVWLAPDPGRRRPALLTVSILAAAGALSILDQYPLGGTRHSFYLLVFAAPAAGAAIAGLLGARRLAPLGLVSLVAAASGILFHPGMSSELRVRRAEALEFGLELRAETAPGDLILIDSKTYYLIVPLLSGVESLEGFPDTSGLKRFRAEGRRYVVFDEWQLDVRGDRDELRDMLGLLDDVTEIEWDPRRHPVWLVSRFSGPPICEHLREDWPDRVDSRAWSFDRRHLTACRLVPEAFLGR